MDKDNVEWCRKNPFLEPFEQLELNLPDLVNEGITENVTTGSWLEVRDWLRKEGLELQQWLNRYEEVKTSQQLEAFNAETPPITLLAAYLNNGMIDRTKTINKAYKEKSKTTHPDKVKGQVLNWEGLTPDQQKSKTDEATEKFQALYLAKTNLDNFDDGGWWAKQNNCYVEHQRRMNDPFDNPSGYAVAARTGVIFGLFALLDKVFIRNRRRSNFRKVYTGFMLSIPLSVLFSLVDLRYETKFNAISGMAIVAVMRAVHTGLKSGGDIVTQMIAILRDNARVIQLAGMHIPSLFDLRKTYDKLRAHAKTAPPVQIAVVAVMVVLLGLKLRRVPRRLW